MKLLKFAGLMVAASGLASVAHAADKSPIAMQDIAELSGGGATVGTHWRDGIDLAIRDINKAGGVLGHPLTVVHADTGSSAGTARALMLKAIDAKPYVILGPGYSGSVAVTGPMAANAKIPEIMGGEAEGLTQKGNGYLFRTSFGQQSTMPKVAKFIQDHWKAKSVAVAYVNNDFGKDGKNEVEKDLKALGINVVADLPSEAGQVDFASDVSKVKAAKPDVLFIYDNEEESANMMKELAREGVKIPIMGETTIAGQKVIDLAGKAADGIYCHVGLTTDANIPEIQKFRKEFVDAYHYVPDHNGMKGWLAVQLVKAVTEKMGKVDQADFAKTLHGMTISAKTDPGILMTVTYSDTGDLSRESFLVHVEDGKQKIVQILPPLKN